MKTIHSVTKTMNPVVYCLDIWNAIFVPLRPSSFLSFSIRFTCSCVNISINPHNWHLAIKVSKSNLCCVILCIDGNKETVSIFCILGFLFVVFVSAIFKRFVHIDDTHETCPMKLSKYVEYYKKKWFKKIMWRSFRLHVDSSGLTDAITIYILVSWHSRKHTTSYPFRSDAKMRSLFNEKFISSEFQIRTFRLKIFWQQIV